MANFDQESKRLYQEALATNSGIEYDGLSNPSTFSQAEQILNSSLQLNKFNDSKTISGGSGKESPSLSLRAYRTYLDLILEEFQRDGKGLKLILSQTALYLLNPDLGRSKIANPLAITFGPPPFAGGIFTNTLDNPMSSMDPLSNSAKNDDIIDKLYKGQRTTVDLVGGIPPVEINGPNTRVPSDTGGTKTAGAGNLPLVGPAIQAVGGATDGITLDEKYKQLNLANKEESERNTFSDKVVFDAYAGINVKTSDPLLYGGDIDIGTQVYKKISPDYEKIFSKRNTGPDFGDGSTGAGFWLPKKGALVSISTQENIDKHKRAVFNVDTFFSPEESEDGLLGSDAITKIPDFTHHVPFFFEDIRYSKNGTGKVLAFRAFIDSISENITPNWQQEQYYGRIDPVSTYQNTSRTFDVNFKIAAFSQDGLKIMWKKINQFCKMAYPTYKEKRLYAGPLIRMRIGDLCASSDGRGLPGFITSITFSYDDQTTWEISNQNDLDKVPHVSTISLQFQVVHEQNPELDENGNFNLGTFRRAGKLPDQTIRTTNQQTQEAEQQDIDGLSLGDSEDSSSPV